MRQLDCRSRARLPDSPLAGDQALLHGPYRLSAPIRLLKQNRRSVPMASTQTVSPWAHGIAVFAGVVMIVGGAFQALEGLAGIVNDKWLIVLPEYVFGFDLTLWGWIHLLVGLALLLIGVSLLRGQ